MCENMKRLQFGIFLLSMILLVGCSQDTKIVLENLEAATPATFIAVYESPDVGRSYVKLVGDVDSSDENVLEKRVYREGDLIAFDPIGVDPDGDVITYRFSRPLNEKGEWKTEIGDAGTYQVEITASDGKTEVEKRVIILVLSANRAPTIENLEDISVAEGVLVILKPKIFDYNGDEVTLHYSKPFDQVGQWQTGYNDSGMYVVKLTVSDNQTTVEKQITIIVTNTNRAPVLKESTMISAFAGDLVTIKPTATDPDGDSVTLSYSDPFSDKGVWQTTENDVGTYTATITASDGALSSETVVSIILNHKNKAPVIMLDNIQAEETDRVVLNPAIVDTEGDSFTVVYSYPFNSSGVWETDYDDAGTYAVTITAADDDSASSSVIITVTVSDKNRAPVFKI